MDKTWNLNTTVMRSKISVPGLKVYSEIPWSKPNSIIAHTLKGFKCYLTWKPQLDSLESAFIGFDNTVKKVNITQYASRGRL